MLDSMKVYLAVPIIANRRLEKAKAMAKIIGNLGHTLVSQWVINDDPGFVIPPPTVFARDLKGVKGCDVLVAEVTCGSHGVGMEVMAAALSKKRIILMFENGTRVSRMLLGVPNAIATSYSSSEDMEAKLESVLLRVQDSMRYCLSS